jgi:hypothetical protein
LHRVKKEWTLEKFQDEVRAGKKYALFDNCVVDLRFYAHPGGQYLLEHCIGSDIGQFLNGSLSNMSQTKPYTHSSYAYSILKSLIIARLKDPTKTEIMTLGNHKNDKHEEANT